MSLLVDMFRKSVEKSKDYRMKVETETPVGYSTGFLTFDFRNGTVAIGKTPDGQQYQYYSIGIADGSMVMIIGRSGCGKTTWTIQAAGNIVKPFPNAAIYHEDIEGGISNSRLFKLAKMTPEEAKDKYIHRNTGITCENFFQRIKMISDIKLANRSEFEYDTGLYDEFGNRLYKLQPTVVILDSLALLMPEKFSDEEEMSGQMSTTATAKANAKIFRTIIPLLKAANIILFVINHITQAVAITPAQRKKAQVSYLKVDESLPKRIA
jgi:RecA/RadA recombinase